MLAGKMANAGGAGGSMAGSGVGRPMPSEIGGALPNNVGGVMPGGMGATDQFLMQILNSAGSPTAAMPTAGTGGICPFALAA